MGMSTRVTGFTPPDKQWQKMKAVWDACEAAGATIPESVIDFFDGETPDPAGVERAVPTREWRREGAQGYEIDVDSIPKSVKTIRFYNSW